MITQLETARVLFETLEALTTVVSDFLDDHTEHVEGFASRLEEAGLPDLAAVLREGE